MTLNDIERMLQLAKVPRSKVVKVTRESLRAIAWQPPLYIVHVPPASYLVIANVVGNLTLKTDNVQVTMLESHDVRDGQHVMFSVPSDIDRYAPDPDVSAKRNAERRRVHNRNVVIDCTAVTLQ